MRSRKSEYSARVAPDLAHLHFQIDHLVAQVIQLALETLREPRVALPQPSQVGGRVEYAVLQPLNVCRGELCLSERRYRRHQTIRPL